MTGTHVYLAVAGGGFWASHPPDFARAPGFCASLEGSPIKIPKFPSKLSFAVCLPPLLVEQRVFRATGMVIAARPRLDTNGSMAKRLNTPETPETVKRSAKRPYITRCSFELKVRQPRLKTKERKK